MSKNIKKTIGNIIFFILLIGITFFLVFKDEDFSNILNIIGSVKIEYMLIAIGAMFGYYLLEAFNIWRILKTFGEKVNIFKALKYTFVGSFFSSITPAASGGQPMEIYHMYKDGISRSYGITALLIQLCCYQIVTIGYGIVAAIINWHMIDNRLIFLVILGLCINSIGLTIMLICLFSKTLTRKLINILIKLMKLVKYKKAEKKIEELEAGLEKYNNGSDFIKKHKSIFIKSIIVVFFQMTLYYIVPFLIYKAFGLNEYNVFKLITIQAVLYSSVSGLPFPGAVGISEGVFMNIYSSIYGSEILSSAMLLNRGVNFYLFVFISAIVTMINTFMFKDKKDEESEKDIKQLDEPKY
ncbi:MAG: flippase-like domain-containing protein [Clostridia bacterium]|nr:flippase-like domain-containing protein [Clostridia bacterium]